MRKISLLVLVILFTVACKKEKQQCDVKTSYFVNDVKVSDSTVVYPYSVCMDQNSGIIIHTVDKDGVIATEVVETSCK